MGDGKLDRLLIGNEEYASRHSDLSYLAEGQDPKYIVVICSDSRCDPETIFNQKPGVIFSVRTAGGLLGEKGLATVQFGIESFNNLESIFIMGHTRCGAVTAAQTKLRDITSGRKPRSLINPLGKIVEEICANISINDQNLNDLDHAIMDNAIMQCKILFENSDTRRVIERKKISVSYGIYDIATLRVRNLSEFHFQKVESKKPEKEKSKS